MSSPTSTGPAGAHFEGKVGAHYLLSLLVGAQPRGLRGMTIDRVELQRASQGMYLDDVIILCSCSRVRRKPKYGQRKWRVKQEVDSRKLAKQGIQKPEG